MKTVLLLILSFYFIAFLPLILCVLLAKSGKFDFEWFPQKKIPKCENVSLKVFDIYD